MSTKKDNLWVAFNTGKRIGHSFVNKSREEILESLRKSTFKELFQESINWEGTDSGQDPYYSAIQKLHENDYSSFEEYRDDIEKEECVQNLSILDRFRLISYALVLYYWTSDNTEDARRVAIWDKLFENIPKENNQECREVYKEVLNSYYQKYELSDETTNYSEVVKSAFSYALYHFWHNTPYVSAVRSTLLNGGNTEFSIALVSTLLGAENKESIPTSWRRAG